MCSSAAQSGPIGGLCRPSSSPQATAAGCTGSDGAALTDSSTACESCSGGFFLFRGGCYSQTGTPGSEICTKAEGGKCTACNTNGNYIFQNKAATVTLGNECILCSDATGDGTTKGVANCNTCQAPNNAGPATCNTCQDGYYLDNNGTCQKCTSPCATCETSATQCTSCSEGKYLKTNQYIDGTTTPCDQGAYADKRTWTCKACSTIDANCGTCEYNEAAGKGRCLTCTGGGKTLVKTEVDGTTTCVNAAGCATDNQAGTHFLSTDSQKCILCNDKSDTSNQGIEGCGMCKKASASDANPTCTACIAGYYTSAPGSPATCVACGANCATCTEGGNDKCSTCKPGYFKQTSDPGTCTSCDDTASGIEGCAACTFSTSLTCNSCKPNYKPSGTKSNSVTCTKVCEDDSACGGTAGACDAIVVDGDGNMKHYCSHCGESTKFPIDGICKGDSDKGNNQCSNGVCTQCADGYFLYMGGCYSTANTPGNLMCTTAAGGFCTAAANSRYFAVPGVTASQQSVLACGNPLGVALSDTNAYVGVEGCRTCEAPTALSSAGMAAAKCTTCDEGKKPNLAGTGCSTCGIPGCSACRADNMCEACGDGYRLEGEACVSTGPNLGTGAIAGISVITLATCPVLLIGRLPL